MIGTDPVALLIGMGVGAGVLVSVVFLVWWLDRYDREPWPVLTLAFCWGLIAAPALVLLSGHLLAGLQIGSIPSALSITPGVEEAAKGLGLLFLVLFSKHFDNPTDGIVYGTAIGLGFAITENTLYGLWSVGRMDQEAAMVLLGARTAFSAGVHALASSLLGVGFGYSKTAGRPLRAVALVSVFGIGAVLLHIGWNAIVPFFAGRGVQAPMLVIAPLYVSYGLALAGMLASEHRILVRQIADEVRLGALPEWTAHVIPFYRRRIRSDWWPSRGERRVMSRLLTRLAFRKHALAARGQSGDLAGLEIVRLRARIQGILKDSRPEE